MAHDVPLTPMVARQAIPPWDGMRSNPSPIPTMLSREELGYLTWLGSKVWTGRGCILEIGPWLGGSTRALAQGVHQNSQARPGALVCVDSFVWKPFMEDRSGLGLKEGDSFLTQFQRNLEGFGEIIRALPAFLPDEAAPGDAEADIRVTQVAESEIFRWATGGPVEILFVDGAKSYSGLQHLLAEVGASLIPGHSLLVFQDYLYWGTYWVPLVVELLGDRLRIAHVLRHNTVSFAVTEPLTPTFVQSLPALDALDWQEGVKLLQRAAQRLEGLGDATAAAIVRVAVVRFLAHKGRLAECAVAFRAAEKSWPAAAPEENLERCRRWLESHRGQALPVSMSRRLKRAWGALAKPFLGRR